MGRSSTVLPRAKELPEPETIHDQPCPALQPAPVKVMDPPCVDRSALKPSKNSPRHGQAPLSHRGEVQPSTKAGCYWENMQQKRFQGQKTPLHWSPATQGWAWFVVLLFWVVFFVTDTHSHFSGRYKYCSF